MLEVNDENDAARMLNSDCKIHVQESEKLLELEKLRNSQMYIEFDDLCYSVHHNRKGKLIILHIYEKTEKKILHNVTGYFEPGKVTVIIGPSGAGKTTLLKIMSAKRLINVKGTITINGVEQNKGTFRKQVCYVPQQFDLLPFLTTRETLYIAARLKLNVNQNEHAIHLVVNDIVKRLDLSYCLNTLANKLSGGERKRLSIGVEIITKPSVLLLDEPTSGLDSVTSNQLLNMLHNMARANCTVVCVIHQPSSQMILLFDNIMVLNRGRCMYCGPKSEILNTYSIAGFTCPSFYNIAEFGKSLFWVSASQGTPLVSFGLSIRSGRVLLAYVVYVESIFKISGRFSQKNVPVEDIQESLNADEKRESLTAELGSQPLEVSAELPPSVEGLAVGWGSAVSCSVPLPSALVTAASPVNLAAAVGPHVAQLQAFNILQRAGQEEGYSREHPPHPYLARVLLEVITEQRDGDLENLYKICRDEYEKIRLHSKHNENGINFCNYFLESPSSQVVNIFSFHTKGSKHLDLGEELDTLTDSKQKCKTHDINTSINKIVLKKSTWQQQRILFLRALICMKRDTILTQLRLATHVVVGLLLGTVFYNFGDNAENVGSNTACLFFFLLFLFFASAMPAVQMFPTEAAVFLQEHLNNWYSLKAYYSVKVLTDLPIQILCVSPFLFISYYMTGQPMEYDRFLQTWSVCLLITIIGQTFGILTGTAFDTELGIFLIPAISIPLLLFSGFFLKLSEMSIYLQPLSFVSFFRYAFEGIMQAVYLDRSNLVCSEIYCYLRSPNKILSMMGMPAVSFYYHRYYRYDMSFHRNNKYALHRVMSNIVASAIISFQNWSPFIEISFKNFEGLFASFKVSGLSNHCKFRPFCDPIINVLIFS
ncbi:ATP-binding cassette sub-family G member 4 [Trachymyrmex cornetzi]|uniref:ATP-binding cassette sub-family G member 4 n=1 Tax=Trachymyrmex cornetzi TaxID=471704 RepID=A0A151JQD4_9HYME|nr:ATP-binding cassette sub-family G member 4 [Trachymyrmex cornetzi]